MKKTVKKSNVPGKINLPLDPFGNGEPVEFEKIRNWYIQQLEPVDAPECYLVEAVARARWMLLCLSRSYKSLAGQDQAALSLPRSLDNILRGQAHQVRQFNQSLKMLAELRKHFPAPPGVKFDMEIAKRTRIRGFSDVS